MNELSSLRSELKASSDNKTRESFSRFFKEPVVGYGVKTPLVTQIGKKYFARLSSHEKCDVFALCEKLFESGYIEESFIACQWSYNMRNSFSQSDIDIFERWIKKYVTNWASCDTFCNHTVGEFLMSYPSQLKRLNRWATSRNRWMRRASVVSLIIPARKGMYTDTVFALSDILLKDTDDMVQKGYGWALKASSESNPDAVFNYVMKNKKEMPRTSLRYAIEKMPADKKQEAMKR